MPRQMPRHGSPPRSALRSSLAPARQARGRVAERADAREHERIRACGANADRSPPTHSRLRARAPSRASADSLRRSRTHSPSCAHRVAERVDRRVHHRPRRNGDAHARRRCRRVAEMAARRRRAARIRAATATASFTGTRTKFASDGKVAIPSAASSATNRARLSLALPTCSRTQSRSSRSTASAVRSATPLTMYGPRAFSICAIVDAMAAA